MSVTDTEETVAARAARQDEAAAAPVVIERAREGSGTHLVGEPGHLDRNILWSLDAECSRRPGS